MRISSLELTDVGPLKRISVQDMADVVVFAGPNGVGKTHINTALIAFAQNPGSFANVHLRIEATCDEERMRWGRPTLDTRNNNEAGLLRSILQRNQRRNKYQSSFLNFDSDRAIRNVAQYQFAWDIGNPLAEELGWNVAFGPMSNRYNDVRHSLFRMVEGQKRQIADEALARQSAGETTMSLAIPDILQPFNQALIVHRDDQTHHAMQALGQSIGVISLGKKLVLVEGQEASLDKLTYGAILKNRFPEFILVPAGGKETIRSFADVQANILSRTIWGIDFYLLCDRDAANILGLAALRAAHSNRVTVLPRYHLENYFLDEKVLVAGFNQIEPDGSWLRDISKVKKRILSIAGVHADIGGGYPEAQSAMAKYPLIWMIDEARKFGLALNEKSVNQLAWGIQGTDSTPLRQVAPHFTGMIHNSMAGAWHILEHIPRSAKHKEWPERKTHFGFYIPAAEPRLIPEDALIHESVVKRMDALPDYQPINLPKRYGTFPMPTAPDGRRTF